MANSPTTKPATWPVLQSGGDGGDEGEGREEMKGERKGEEGEGEEREEGRMGGKRGLVEGRRVNGRECGIKKQRAREKERGARFRGGVE